MRLVDPLGDCPFEPISLFGLSATLPLQPGQWQTGCGYLEHKGVRIESFTHLGPHGYYRLLYLKRRDQAPQRLMIYLAGGPRHATTSLGVERFRVELVVSLAARDGTGVLVPEYLGTRNRSLYPRADTGPAAEEVLGIADLLRSSRPRAAVSLVAVSAGTYVALQSLRRRAVPTVFVVPPTASGREFLADTAGTDVLPNARGERVRFYRYRREHELEEATATIEEQLSAFLGRDFDRSLADLIGELPPLRRGCLAIVYGTEDRRVRNERLAEVRRRFPSIPISAVEGMGHGPANEEQAEALAHTVAAVMPRRCS